MPMLPQAIYLYDDPDALGLDVDSLGQWLRRHLPAVTVAVRADFLTHHLAGFGDREREVIVAALQEQLAAAAVENLVHPADRKRLPAEDPTDRGWETVYLGPTLQAVFEALVPAAESGAGQGHVVWTMDVLGDWVEGQSLLRPRVLFPGLPHLISLGTLLSGAQRPRQYHFLRQQMVLLGAAEHLEDLEEVFQEEGVDFGDWRLNDLSQGLVVRALFQQWAGESGCRDATCWLHAGSAPSPQERPSQAEGSGLCARHARLWRQWGGLPL